MTRTTRPPGFSRPPGSGSIRPGGNRGRPQATSKASKSSKLDPTQLHDEPEIDGEEPSLQGEDRRDAGDEALVKLKEYRQDRQEFKSNAEGDASHGGKGSAEAFIPGPNTPQTRKPALEAQKSAPGAPAPTAAASFEGAALPRMDDQLVLNSAKKPALEGDPAQQRSSEHRLTADMQKAAQDNPKRNVYGAVIKKATGEAAPSSSTAPTAPAAPTAPLQTAGPSRLGQAAPLRSPAPPSVAAPPPMRSSSRGPDARTLLSAGKPVGTFLSEYAANHPEVSEALKGAVSEAQRLLTGLKGISRVAAGNYKGESVVFMDAERGLSRETLRALPDKVQDFKAILRLTFDALPLKRPLGGK